MISIWRFADAPEHFRRLSEHGGDEDWVAHVPKKYLETWLIDVFFTQNVIGRNPFGVCDIQRVDLQGGGGAVFIGAHA